MKNKFSRDIKESLLNALEQLGGDQWFVKLGKGRYKGSMASLVGKLIPIQMAGAGPGTPEEQAAKVREFLAKANSTTAGGKKP